MNYAELFRIRPFRNLWLGQAISQLGDAFYFIAFLFMVDKITHDTAVVGYVGALEALPYLFLGPLAGVLADRIDRRRLMLVSDLASAGILVLLAVSLYFNPVPARWLLYVVPVLLSVTRVFFGPARGAAVPAVVPPEKLTAANSLSMTTQNIVLILGLSLTAGVLSALWGISPQWFFLSVVLLNSLSFFGSALFVFMLPNILPDRDLAQEHHALDDLKQGFRFVCGRHDLWVLTVMLAVFRLSIAPFFVFYLAVNDRWFGGHPSTIAWFEASFCVGMIIASTFAGKLKVVHPTQWFCYGLAAAGLTVALMAFNPSVPLFLLWNFLAGIAIPIADIPIITYLQVSVPDAYRGRVTSLREMVATGVMPIGMVLAGTLLKRMGVEAGFIAMGLGMIISCLAGLLDPRFRQVTMPVTDPAEGIPASPRLEGVQG